MAIIKTQLNIAGMNCASCGAHIEGDLKKLKGVKDAKVNLVLNRGEVEYDESVVSEEDIIVTVGKAGYAASTISEAVHHGSNHEGHGGGAAPMDDHSSHSAPESDKATTSRWQKFITAAILSVGVG